MGWKNWSDWLKAGIIGASIGFFVFSVVEILEHLFLKMTYADPIYLLLDLIRIKGSLLPLLLYYFLLGVCVCFLNKFLINRKFSDKKRIYLLTVCLLLINLVFLIVAFFAEPIGGLESFAYIYILFWYFILSLTLFPLVFVLLFILLRKIFYKIPLSVRKILLVAIILVILLFWTFFFANKVIINNSKCVPMVEVPSSLLEDIQSLESSAKNGFVPVSIRAQSRISEFFQNNTVTIPGIYALLNNPCLSQETRIYLLRVIGNTQIISCGLPNGSLESYGRYNLEDSKEIYQIAKDNLRSYSENNIYPAREAVLGMDKHISHCEHLISLGY